MYAFRRTAPGPDPGAARARGGGGDQTAGWGAGGRNQRRRNMSPMAPSWLRRARTTRKPAALLREFERRPVSPWRKPISRTAHRAILGLDEVSSSGRGRRHTAGPMSRESDATSGPRDPLPLFTGTFFPSGLPDVYLRAEVGPRNRETCRKVGSKIKPETGGSPQFRPWPGRVGRLPGLARRRASRSSVAVRPGPHSRPNFPPSAKFPPLKAVSDKPGVPRRQRGALSTKGLRLAGSTRRPERRLEGGCFSFRRIPQQTDRLVHLTRAAFRPAARVACALVVGTPASPKIFQFGYSS